MIQKINHTFVICAYQENPFLEECILSIKNQTVLGDVLISTSTMNSYIQALAKKYDIDVIVNHGPDSAAENWSFGYAQANTRLVTLCHQDDYYFPNYLEKILEYADRTRRPLIFFTDYCEDRKGVLVEKNLLLSVKHIMNFPLKFRLGWKQKWLRRKILSFGCSICCPSVTFCKDNIPGDPFPKQYRNNIDWDTWINLSSLDGEFIYCPQKLMAHRIWEASTTSLGIADSSMRKENYEIFCRFWPKPIARLLLNIYSHSEKSNDME